MSFLDNTLTNMAPGVSYSRELTGRYNPRHGLVIYCLPIPDYQPTAPGIALGEALAARSGLGCAMLDGVPEKVPEGAVVIGQYAALKAIRPDLLEDIPEPRDPNQYAIRLGRSAVIASPSREGLAAGMQTLAMLILRHNEPTIPAVVIVDTPLCQSRILAVELESGEISVNLLMQIVSFAATFKANALHFILDENFNTSRAVSGIETFVQTCQSHGIEIGVRLPWLASILSGKRTLVEAWSGIRAAARVFGARQAALDDPCPPDVDPEMAAKIVGSMVDGKVGLKGFSVDAALLRKADCPASELRAAGIIGWSRLVDEGDEPPGGEEEFALRIDVQGPIAGFSSRTTAAFHRRLNTATRWLRTRQRRECVVSFRGVGVSHLWQNLLYPAATGLIATWGNPDDAERCAWRFANLLYGERASQVMSMWETIALAFPPGLSLDEERRIRRTAFGAWPETEEEREFLGDIQWLEVIRNIRTAAEALKNVAGGLTRNLATLTGAKLSLQALSWLHCFVALMPELARRRKLRYDADGRTEPIARELYENFTTWQESLRELSEESGLEIAEMRQIDAMGHRLKGLCDGIFE